MHSDCLVLQALNINSWYRRWIWDSWNLKFPSPTVVEGGGGGGDGGFSMMIGKKERRKEKEKKKTFIAVKHHLLWMNFMSSNITSPIISGKEKVACWPAGGGSPDWVILPARPIWVSDVILNYRNTAGCSYFLLSHCNYCAVKIYSANHKPSSAYYWCYSIIFLA